MNAIEDLLMFAPPHLVPSSKEEFAYRCQVAAHDWPQKLGDIYEIQPHPNLIHFFAVHGSKGVSHDLRDPDAAANESGFECEFCS
jgi:hypothetical protein